MGVEGTVDVFLQAITDIKHRNLKNIILPYPESGQLKNLSPFLHQCTFRMHRLSAYIRINGEVGVECEMVAPPGELIAL